MFFLEAREICPNVFDGTHDSPKPMSIGFPLITSKHIVNGELDIENATLISHDDFVKIQRRSKIKQWDILFSMIGSVGKLYLEKNTNPSYTIKNIGVFSCGEEELAYKVYYYLQTPFARNYLKSFQIGAVQQFLNLEQLRKFPIPDLSFINNIVLNLLKDIDKKIELNRHINRNLEAMIENLTDYILASSILYQKKIEEVASIKAGGDCPKSYSKKKEINTPIPIFSNGIINDGLYGFTSDSEKSIAERSLTVSARGTIGATFIRMERFVPIIRLIAITPHKKGVDVWIHQMLKRMKFERNGSVQQQLTVPEISKLKFSYPTDEVLERYEKITTPLVEQITRNQRENMALQKQRDGLLPLLINGQVSVID